MKKYVKGRTMDTGRAVAALSDQVESSDILRVVKKVRMHMQEESLNPIFQAMDTEGVEPSALNIMECVRMLAEYVSKHAADKHPIYTADVLLEKYDLTVKEAGVAFINPEKEGDNKIEEVASTMGILTTDPTKVSIACASTLLSYVTSEGEKGIDNIFKDPTKLSLMKMPRINGIDIRDALKTYKKSPSVSRDMIYEQINSNLPLGMLMMGRIFGMTTFHRKNAKIIPVLKQMKEKVNANLISMGDKPLTYEPNGACPGVYKMDYSFAKTPRLNSVFATKFIIEQTIGSTGGKRGGLTAGYYYMEMTPSLIKNILRAKEIIALLAEFKLNRVFLPSGKDYGTTLIRILLRNGVIVIGEAGSGVDRSEFVGYYRSTKKACMYVMISPFGKPTWSSAGVMWNDKGHKDSMEVFKDSPPYTVVSTFLTPVLMEEVLNDVSIHIYPSLFAHACRVWLCNSPTRYNYKFKEEVQEDINLNIQRMASAMFSRVKFPLTRRPFYASDVRSELFKKDIVIPRVDRKEKNSLDIYKIDVDEKRDEQDDILEKLGMEDKYKKVLSDIPDKVSIANFAESRLRYIFFVGDVREQMKRLEEVGTMNEFNEMLPFFNANEQFVELSRRYHFKRMTKEVVETDEDDEEEDQGEVQVDNKTIILTDDNMTEAMKDILLDMGDAVTENKTDLT